MEWEPRKYICHQHISNVFDFWRQKRYFDILVVRANLCALSFSVDITWSESKKRQFVHRIRIKDSRLYFNRHFIFLSTYCWFNEIRNNFYEINDYMMIDNKRRSLSYSCLGVMLDEDFDLRGMPLQKVSQNCIARHIFHFKDVSR